MRVTPEGGRTLATGRHFASPALVPDTVAVSADGTFTFQGRHGDMVKVAGRRASFAALNRLLLELPGLDDGVFYLPDTGNPVERLCVIYEGARLDAVFMPRVFIRVERLPRTDGGKLPRSALDRVFARWQSAVDPRPAPPFAVTTGIGLPS